MKCTALKFHVRIKETATCQGPMPIRSCAFCWPVANSHFTLWRGQPFADLESQSHAKMRDRFSMVLVAILTSTTGQHELDWRLSTRALTVRSEHLSMVIGPGVLQVAVLQARWEQYTLPRNCKSVDSWFCEMSSAQNPGYLPGLSNFHTILNDPLDPTGRILHFLVA